MLFWLELDAETLSKKNIILNGIEIDGGNFKSDLSSSKQDGIFTEEAVTKHNTRHNFEIWSFLNYRISFSYWLQDIFSAV